MLVGGNWGLLNQCHAACLKWIIEYIFLSTQCLSSTWERLDCTDLGNKVRGVLPLSAPYTSLETGEHL